MEGLYHPFVGNVICCHSTKAASDVGVEKNSHFIAGNDASKENKSQRRAKSAAFWDALESLSSSS
jgi:hypothetical protein